MNETKRMFVAVDGRRLYCKSRGLWGIGSDLGMAQPITTRAMHLTTNRSQSLWTRVSLNAAPQAKTASDQGRMELKSTTFLAWITILEFEMTKEETQTKSIALPHKVTKCNILQLYLATNRRTNCKSLRLKPEKISKKKNTLLEESILKKPCQSKASIR